MGKHKMRYTSKNHQVQNTTSNVPEAQVNEDLMIYDDLLLSYKEIYKNIFSIYEIFHDKMSEYIETEELDMSVSIDELIVNPQIIGQKVATRDMLLANDVQTIYNQIIERNLEIARKSSITSVLDGDYKRILKDIRYVTEMNDTFIESIRQIIVSSNPVELQDKYNTFISTTVNEEHKNHIITLNNMIDSIMQNFLVVYPRMTILLECARDNSKLTAAAKGYDLEKLKETERSKNGESNE